MEAAVDAAAPPSPPNKDIIIIAKGKRTKRQRPHDSPPAANNNNENGPASAESTTTEEVDTARCLILLSRGGYSYNFPIKHKNNVYTCKTCNRSFPSFQALGGHRTSHKKPRNDKLRPTYPFFDDQNRDFLFSPSSRNTSRLTSLNPLSLQLSNAFVSSASLVKSSPSPRIHECSYCGAEFTSGQALGGHMRKHRAGPAAARSSVEPRESKSLIVLSLDLNLPAPDDNKEKSPQGTNQRLIRPSFSHPTTAQPLMIDYH